MFRQINSARTGELFVLLADILQLLLSSSLSFIVSLLVHNLSKYFQKLSHGIWKVNKICMI